MNNYPPRRHEILNEIAVQVMEYLLKSLLLFIPQPSPKQHRLLVLPSIINHNNMVRPYCWRYDIFGVYNLEIKFSNWSGKSPWDLALIVLEALNSLLVRKTKQHKTNRLFDNTLYPAYYTLTSLARSAHLCNNDRMFTWNNSLILCIPWLFNRSKFYA